MNLPLISILMPAKNADLYLEACLDSILNQSHESWELLVVEDHSSDKTWSILEDYCRKDKRICIFKNTGNGIIDALNLAFDHAQGDFITRMDADDIMPIDKLEVLSKQLQTAGEGHVSTGKVKYIASHKILQNGYLKYEDWLNKLCGGNNQWNEIWKECVIASPNWMCYKSDLHDIGGVCNHVYPEDYELCFRMYEAGFKVISSNQTTHIWRDHNERTSRHSEHYVDNRFLALKIKYFLKTEHTKYEQIVLWGAGKKGKQLARLLNEHGVQFIWVCDNKKKVGHIISNHQLIHYDEIKSLDKTAVLVSTTQDHCEIREFCDENSLSPLFLC